MRSGSAAASAAALALLAIGCRHTTPAAAANGLAIAAPAAPRPFAALYRLECCGQSGLLVTLRGDGERLAVAVASPPAGVVLEAWLEPGQGWLRRGGATCVQPLRPATLPLPGGATVPLDPRLAAALVSGAVPADARRSARRPGWSEQRVQELTVAWELAPAGAPVTGVEITSEGEETPRLIARLSQHHGRIPGRVTLRAGRETADFRLVEWRSGGPLERPAWVAGRTCAEAAR